MEEPWKGITDSITSCSACASFCDCTKKIIGMGDIHAPAVFIWDGPSRSDCISGKAFSGRTGKYFLKMLHKAGYRKGDVYLTYAIKCKYYEELPPKEVQGFCSLHLLRQLDAIKPRLVVAMGSVAFGILCPQVKRELGGCRGDKIPSLGYTIMPVWHPNFVLSSFSVLREKELEKDINRSYRYTFYGSSEK